MPQISAVRLRRDLNDSPRRHTSRSDAIVLAGNGRPSSTQAGLPDYAQPVSTVLSTCVIFDLDGTLVDSEGLCNQAFLDLLPDVDDGVETLTQRYRGRKLSQIIADLEARLARSLPGDFEKTYRERVAELFATELRPMPGVPDMLDALAHPCCIASSGPLPKIRQALEVSRIQQYFGDNLFSSYEIKSWKPDPGLFLHAASSMGFSPAMCVVVEDSDMGIEGPSLLACVPCTTPRRMSFVLRPPRRSVI